MFSKYYRHISQTLCKLKTINSVRNIGNQALNHGRFQEVEIEVPWGKICDCNDNILQRKKTFLSFLTVIKHVTLPPGNEGKVLTFGGGKYWGPRNVQPIIAMHGIGDNASSFDPLATRLPENVSLFALDLPGHGLSSWIPRGFEYTIIINVQVLNRVRDHFKIDKLKLLGHSVGGITSFTYTSIYPSDVKYIIALDNYKPITYNASAILTLGQEYRKAFFKNERLSTPRNTYTEEEAINKRIKISNYSLDVTLSNILIERGMTKQPDGTLSFNDDRRVTFLAFDYVSSVDYMKLLAEQIRCPFMFIKGDYFDRVDNIERYYEVLKVIEERSQDFRSHSLPGTHHFHMSNPEPVAALINPFILKYAD